MKGAKTIYIIKKIISSADSACAEITNVETGHAFCAELRRDGGKETYTLRRAEGEVLETLTGIAATVYSPVSQVYMLLRNSSESMEKIYGSGMLKRIDIESVTFGREGAKFSAVMLFAYEGEEYTAVVEQDYTEPEMQESFSLFSDPALPPDELYLAIEDAAQSRFFPVLADLQARLMNRMEDENGI